MLYKCFQGVRKGFVDIFSSAPEYTLSINNSQQLAVHLCLLCDPKASQGHLVPIKIWVKTSQTEVSLILLYAETSHSSKQLLSVRQEKN